MCLCELYSKSNMGMKKVGGGGGLILTFENLAPKSVFSNEKACFIDFSS